MCEAKFSLGNIVNVEFSLRNHSCGDTCQIWTWYKGSSIYLLQNQECLKPRIDLLHKSHNAPVPYPTMHHLLYGIFVQCIMGIVRWVYQRMMTLLDYYSVQTKSANELQWLGRRKSNNRYVLIVHIQFSCQATLSHCKWKASIHWIVIIHKHISVWCNYGIWLIL